MFKITFIHKHFLPVDTPCMTWVSRYVFQHPLQKRWLHPIPQKTSFGSIIIQMGQTRVLDRVLTTGVFSGLSLDWTSSCEESSKYILMTESKAQLWACRSSLEREGVNLSRLLKVSTSSFNNLSTWKNKFEFQ